MNQNVGHGHVRPRPDGVRARCGGPRICAICMREKARFDQEEEQALGNRRAELQKAMNEHRPLGKVMKCGGESQCEICQDLLRQQSEIDKIQQNVAGGFTPRTEPTKLGKVKFDSPMRTEKIKDDCPVCHGKDTIPQDPNDSQNLAVKLCPKCFPEAYENKETENSTMEKLSLVQNGSPRDEKSFKWEEIHRDIAGVINRHSLDSFLNTPDYLLADFVLQSLKSHREFLLQRSQWFGKDSSRKEF